MKKKLTIILVSIIIIGVLGILFYQFYANGNIILDSDNNIVISPDEKCIATIYYDYELGIDASRGYDLFIYQDNNGYKYEIKYGEVTIAGPSVMETKGYGKLLTSNDLEKLNKAYKMKKTKYETFSIRYRIMNQDNTFEFCELDKFNEFLFQMN